VKRIRWIKDSDGQEIGLVPLGRNGCKGMACLSKSDIYYLATLGLSFRWDRLPSGHVIAHASRSPSRHVYPSRVLLDCCHGEQAVHRDGDNTNLRRGNLVKIVGGKSKRRDRDYLKSLEEVA
jgi:hypothetical protein